MRLGSHVVRFDMQGIPAVGNTATGSLVGLTVEGADLCDAMLEREVNKSEVPAGCAELVEYLAVQGYMAGEDRLANTRLASAYLHVSNACNLSCVGCYSVDSDRNRVPDPTLEQLRRAIGVLSQLGVTKLVISGGEPFMRPDLPELARCARNEGMESITILTNGTCCTDDILSRLCGYVDTISVSFDGVSSQSPAYIRGSQLFDTLVDAVRRIQVAGIVAHMLPTLYAKNVDDVQAYLDLAEDLGCTVGFSLLSGEPACLGELIPDNECLVKLANTMFSLVSSGKKVALSDAFSPASALSVRVSCGAGRTSVSVAADGTVYPCHMLHKPEFALGNAFTDDSSAITDNLSQFTMPSVEEIEDCSSCENRYFCGGGCRARAYGRHGCLKKRDPYCAYYGHAIDQSVEAFIKRVRG